MYDNNGHLFIFVCQLMSHNYATKRLFLPSYQLRNYGSSIDIQLDLVTFVKRAV